MVKKAEVRSVFQWIRGFSKLQVFNGYLLSGFAQVHTNGKTSPVGYDDTEDSNSSSTCSTNVADANQQVQVTNAGGIPSGATVQSPNSITTLGIAGPPPSTNLPDWYNPPSGMPPPPSLDYHHHALSHHHHLMHSHHHGATAAYWENSPASQNHFLSVPWRPL